MRDSDRIYEENTKRKELKDSIHLSLKSSRVRVDKFNKSPQSKMPIENWALYEGLLDDRATLIRNLRDLTNERARREDDEDFYTSGKKEYVEKCVEVYPKAIKVISTLIQILEDQDESRMGFIVPQYNDILEEVETIDSNYELGVYSKLPKRGYTIK